eukprot:Selendium_serpulae@DN5297_c0_g1_i2.p1
MGQSDEERGTPLTQPPADAAFRDPAAPPSSRARMRLRPASIPPDPKLEENEEQPLLAGGDKSPEPSGTDLRPMADPSVAAASGGAAKGDASAHKPQPTPSTATTAGITAAAEHPGGSPGESVSTRTVDLRGEMHPMAKRTRNCFNLMPVVFILLIIMVLYSIFIGYHCVPMLQLGVEPQLRNMTKFNWAIADLVIYNTLFVLFMTCYVLSIVTPAGTIPDKPEWNYISDREIDYNLLPPAAEVKRTGERRHCRWCCKVKPDRTHHCRVCRRCVLKMDHHCPWIFNCVGWGNHKYFLLVAFYSAFSTVFEAIRLGPSVVEAVQQPLAPFGKVVLLLFGETLVCFIALIVTGFFLFHCMLNLRAETTIEFCERRFDGQHPIGLFNKGWYQNVKDVLGPNPFLWLIPIDNREGDGMVFITEGTRLMIDLESKPQKACPTMADDDFSKKGSKEKPAV